MASICPQCRRELREDAVCCARVRHNWKCRQCGKRSAGFVVPYGRCYLCGGENDIVDAFDTGDATAVRIVQEALQLEVDTFHFYRLAGKRSSDDAQRELFKGLADMEREHVSELEQKYHVHLEASVLEMQPDAERLLAGWMFEGLDPVTDRTAVRRMYDMALRIEKRNRDHFRRRAEELPPGPEHEICRELAAEEEDHVAMLETELASYTSATA